MSDYYESGKPFKRSEWNKLIEDLNELFQNPPGDCEAIDAIDEAEADHVWTREDVEEVREKMMELCPDINFDWEGEPLLEKPWSEEIIDEIEDQMAWCDCGTDITNLGIAEPALASPGGDCGVPEPDSPDLIKDLIDGNNVGSSGLIGRTWRVWRYDYITTIIPDEYIHEHRGVLVVSGSVSCEGDIEYEPNPARYVGKAIYTYFIKHPGYDCGHSVNTNRLASATGQVANAEANGQRTEWELEIRTDYAEAAEC